jgi:hypothetical protein
VIVGAALREIVRVKRRCDETLPRCVSQTWHSRRAERQRLGPHRSNPTNLYALDVLLSLVNLFRLASDYKLNDSYRDPMSGSSKHRARSRPLVSAVAFGWLIGSLPLDAAPRDRMVVVSPSEGQGLDRCLARDDQACGKVSADAICRASGLHSSRAFGLAEDVTGTVLDHTSPKLQPGALVVDCGS